MIQDISPVEYDVAYRQSAPEAESVVLCYRKETVLLCRALAARFLEEDNKKLQAEGQSAEALPAPLCMEEQERLFPRYAQAAAWGLCPEDGRCFEKPAAPLGAPGKAGLEFLRYGFSLDGRAFFVGMVSKGELPEKCEEQEFAWFPVRIFRSILPNVLSFAGITGAHIFRFYRDNRYCGRCGLPMVHSSWERAMCCQACALTEYPKIAPAVIVGVTHKDQILLSRYAAGAYRKYSLLAGFCEVGESFPDTIRRELWEEVGIRVKNIRYYKSQPWALTETMLAGFFAELDGPGEITLEERELSEAAWFSRADIPENPSTMSLTNEMIRYFKEHPEAFT